jgi:hypothetical protein
MLILKSTLAIISAVAALGSGAPSHSSAQDAHASRHSACRHVTIQHKRACLAPGRYCTRQWQRTYRKYGYTCDTIDSNDRYHLSRIRRR